MKDGRPSLISDIRYFCGSFHPHNSYLEAHQDVIVFGRRMAWFLNSEGLSLGAYPALYLCFVPGMDDGSIRVSGDGGDWWQRYTYIGVPDEFPNLENSSEIAIRGTTAALKAIRPDCTSLIDTADKTVSKYGDNLRFLIRSKQYQRYILDVSITIVIGDNPSLLYLTITDRQTGEYTDLDPIPLAYNAEGFELASSFKLSDVEIDKTSVGQLSVQWSPELRNGWPTVVQSKHLPTGNQFLTNLVKRQR